MYIIMIRKIIILLCISFAAGLIFSDTYVLMVDSRIWASHVPESVSATREYFKIFNPGDFFRIFSPINQVLSILLFIACWNLGPAFRWLCLFALLAAVGADVLTFAYFYPRNHILMHEPLTHVDFISSTIRQWQLMTPVRSLLMATDIIIYFIILNRLPTKTRKVSFS